MLIKTKVSVHETAKIRCTLNSAFSNRLLYTLKPTPRLSFFPRSHHQFLYHCQPFIPSHLRTLFLYQKRNFPRQIPQPQQNSTKSDFTFARKQHLERNCLKAIPGCNVRLKRESNELQHYSKSLRISFNRSPNKELRNFLMDGQYYTTCVKCQKLSVNDEIPTL